MCKIIIKPAPGLKIRNPINQIHIKSEGEAVENNTFWRRRLKDGSVVLANSDKPAIKVQKKEEFKKSK